MNDDDFGLADPEEEKLRKLLDEERLVPMGVTCNLNYYRNARAKIEGVHSHNVIQAKEAGARLVEAIIKYQSTLFTQQVNLLFLEFSYY